MASETRVSTMGVDADGHYVEPAHLHEYIEPKYQDVAPRLVKKPDGTEWWQGRGWWDDLPPYIRESGLRASVLGGLAGVERWDRGSSYFEVRGLQYSDMNPAATKPLPRLKVMDEERMDIAVLYPTRNLHWMSDAAYHLAMNRAINDWLAQEYLWADPKRLIGAVNVGVIHDVAAACDEVRRCVQRYRFKAVYLRPSLPDPNVRWWHKTYDPFWATCQELDIAVGLHPFSGDTAYGSARSFDLIGGSNEQLFMRTAFNNPVDCIYTLFGITVGGVLERFPRLRVGILEAGGGWLPSFLERLDGRFEHLRHTVPALTMKPSDYFRRQCWISFDPEEAALPFTAQWLGADGIIWGSDFPHNDAFYPGFLQRLQKQIGGLSRREQDRIRRLNALAFYKLG